MFRVLLLRRKTPIDHSKQITRRCVARDMRTFLQRKRRTTRAAQRPTRPFTITNATFCFKSHENARNCSSIHAAPNRSSETCVFSGFRSEVTALLHDRIERQTASGLDRRSRYLGRAAFAPRSGADEVGTPGPYSSSRPPPRERTTSSPIRPATSDVRNTSASKVAADSRRHGLRITSSAPVPALYANSRPGCFAA